MRQILAPKVEYRPVKNSQNLPQAFLERTLDMLHDDEHEAFLSACITPLRKSIRVNTLKISVPSFLERVRIKNWILTPIPWCSEGFWIDREEKEREEIPLGKTGDHMMGLFYIQEASSMLPPRALFHRETGIHSVLDVAAAPGSKTTQMAAIMGNRGVIIANELSGSRMKGLYSNIERLGIRNTVLCHSSGEHIGERFFEAFDAILLDAPCTAEGTFRKDRTALQYWSEKKILAAARIQKKLIRSAFEALKPGGTLVYSTCTLSSEENEEVMHSLRETYPEIVEFVPLHALFPKCESALTEDGFLRIWPHLFDSEGFFVAKIRKKIIQKQQRTETHKNEKRFPFTPVPRSRRERVADYYFDHFGFDLSSFGERLWERGNEVWLFPEDFRSLLGRIAFDRIGITICEIHEKGIRSSHEMAQNFGSHFSKNCLSLSSEEAEGYFSAKDIPLKERTGDGEVLLTFDSFPLGFGRIMEGRVKNSLPRAVSRNDIKFQAG